MFDVNISKNDIGRLIRFILVLQYESHLRKIHF